MDNIRYTWGCSLLAKLLLYMHKALGRIPVLNQNKQTNSISDKKKKKNWNNCG